MASSSSVPLIKIDTNESYVLKERTMTIPLNKLDVQVEATVDFGSLERNIMDIKGYFAAQHMLDYFTMINRPSYENLVKDFWVKAEVFYRRNTKEEEVRAVKENPRLKGKSREEMGLRPFNGTKIRSTVMGMEIPITVDTIARACRCSNDGQYQKGGGTGSPSLDHKLVLCFIATYEKINLPKYILHHICWALRESQRIGRRQIPFGRLLSEIFVQGKLLKYLKESGVSSDEELGTVNTGEIIRYASIPDKIGGAPLKVKGKRSKNAEKDDVSAPKPKRAKTAKAEGSTASASDEVIQKKRKKEPEVRDAAREAALRETVIQKKRSRETKVRDAAREAALREEDEPQMKKRKTPLFTPMVEITSEQEQRAKEVVIEELAKRNELAELYRQQRDEKLKAAGLLEVDSQSVEKASEVQTVLLQEVVPRREGTSEAHASESEATISDSPKGIPSSSHSVDYVHVESDSTPSISSDSTTSSFDLDDITLSQKYNIHSKNPSSSSKTNKEPESSIYEHINELASQRLKATEHLPPDHPLNRDSVFFKPLSVVLPETNPEPEKASEVASTEVSSEQPQHQQPSSPSNLSSLEKHLGGEMCLTPQKASETLPEQTVSENQQSEPSSFNLSEQFVPELSVSEQTVSEQPTLETQS
ncbi:hypothetical protein MtrunA17_Chr6g0472081 [Medicago truncatula]|uniref:Uncharacterized protein n=1 Tax=Medicago truncatula TaxID=3880 RepID=A0A396HLF2_MEDTR|nr:hypothetical protein MtrunA17_Chr6g0472081 [Medicago truncatula]